MSNGHWLLHLTQRTCREDQTDWFSLLVLWMRFGGQFPWEIWLQPHSDRGSCQLLLSIPDRIGVILWLAYMINGSWVISQIYCMHTWCTLNFRANSGWVRPGDGDMHGQLGYLNCSLTNRSGVIVTTNKTKIFFNASSITHSSIQHFIHDDNRSYWAFCMECLPLAVLCYFWNRTFY